MCCTKFFVSWQSSRNSDGLRPMPFLLDESSGTAGGAVAGTGAVGALSAIGDVGGGGDGLICGSAVSKRLEFSSAKVVRSTRESGSCGGVGG